ncbi:hypothetical protein [Bacillus sp. es.034]|uniref:DUF6944 family repetitive protein n=1 Tax=Bacillus sp. es.034 TaxID=1761763 RepID=UPI000BF6C7B5|nr:hypothetical protein [Bacillus sp. es.034]PFG04805.1 hypothetical protein ATG71_1600 [Bacillus sp. es.034]
MGNEQKATFGAWVAAIGTVIAAIGSTPIKRIPRETLRSFNLVGNELQATGNALEADAIEEFSLTKVGNEIQAIGNVTVIAGIVIDFNTIIKQELNIKGNLLQALGGASALADSFDEEHTLEELYSIYGNLLQVIGNSLQAISGILTLNNKDSGNLNVVGSWIQAIGAIISALVQTKESST